MSVARLIRLWLVVLLWAAGAGVALADTCQPDIVKLRDNGLEVRFNVELAITPEERSRGLMFRESMPRQSGMLFVFDPPQPVAFWMKNTLIPLDMIFTDRRGVVIKVHRDAIPGDESPIPGGNKVFSVLEINAGLSERYGLRPGTVLQHEIFSDGPAAWPC